VNDFILQCATLIKTDKRVPSRHKYHGTAQLTAYQDSENVASIA